MGLRIQYPHLISIYSVNIMMLNAHIDFHIIYEDCRVVKYFLLFILNFFRVAIVRYYFEPS